MTSSTKTLLVKVPAVTAFFWIIKILATTVGETFADFLNEKLGFGLSGTSLVMGTALVAALIVQFAVKRYIPVVYWLAIVLISVAGTLITDNLTDGLGVALWISSVVFAALLAITFAIWFRGARTLAMKSIVTKKREAFYWLAILFTFALGTATGDWLAEAVGLGYGVSALVYGGAIAVVALLWKRGLVGEITAFWIAYILTRPLGASIGDLLSQSHKSGGLGLGPTNTSYIFLAAILGAVIYLSVSKKDRLKA
ncbi:hypothetical protein [Rhodoluna sp.]|uniref:COG4705 family protein n=1 Tax=Rhodoluna sp. TaxID=1969481 RepID=UPI0025E7E7E1|nr:hypothetical protein [Rhodoluna sp.]